MCVGDWLMIMIMTMIMMIIMMYLTRAGERARSSSAPEILSSSYGDDAFLALFFASLQLLGISVCVCVALSLFLSR